MVKVYFCYISSLRCYELTLNSFSNSYSTPTQTFNKLYFSFHRQQELHLNLKMLIMWQNSNQKLIQMPWCNTSASLPRWNSGIMRVFSFFLQLVKTIILTWFSGHLWLWVWLLGLSGFLFNNYRSAGWCHSWQKAGRCCYVWIRENIEASCCNSINISH